MNQTASLLETNLRKCIEQTKESRREFLMRYAYEMSPPDRRALIGRVNNDPEMISALVDSPPSMGLVDEPTRRTLARRLLELRDRQTYAKLEKREQAALVLAANREASLRRITDLLSNGRDPLTEPHAVIHDRIVRHSDKE